MFYVYQLPYPCSVKKLAFSLILVATLFMLSMSVRRSTVDGELLRIAQEYQTYSLYDANANWTYSFCEPMTNPYKGDTMHMSFADPKKSPHGNLIYKLYVKNPEVYNSFKVQPEGQVLIKEVWNVRKLDRENDTVVNKNSHNPDSTKTIPLYLNINDREYYTPTTRKQLFIMYKTKPSKENDKGWWYGIVDIEQGIKKATVIESMKINRCVQCHQYNKTDRIFGATY